jgi:hypothetical protein
MSDWIGAHISGISQDGPVNVYGQKDENGLLVKLTITLPYYTQYSSLGNMIPFGSIYPKSGQLVIMEPEPALTPVRRNEERTVKRKSTYSTQ